MLKLVEPLFIAVADKAARRKARCRALEIALADALKAAGLPPDAMDAKVEKLAAEFHAEALEKLEDFRPSAAAKLDTRTDEEMDGL